VAKAYASPAGPSNREGLTIQKWDLLPQIIEIRNDDAATWGGYCINRRSEKNVRPPSMEIILRCGKNYPLCPKSLIRKEQACLHGYSCQSLRRMYGQSVHTTMGAKLLRILKEQACLQRNYGSTHPGLATHIGKTRRINGTPHNQPTPLRRVRGTVCGIP